MKSCRPGYKIDCPAVAPVDDCLVIEPQFQLFWICDCLPDNLPGVCKVPLISEGCIVAFDHYFSFLASVHLFFAPLFLSKCRSSESSMSGQKTLYFAIQASSSARPFGWRV